MTAARLLITLTLVAVASGLPVPASAQTLTRDYKFEETLMDNTGQGPELKAFNGMVGFRVYRFAPGQGLHLEKSGVTDHYTVEVALRFERNTGWQKIIDFKNRTSDRGLYVYNGQLQFYNFGIGGSFETGREYRIRLERDRDSRRVRGFLDGQQVFEYADTANDAVFEAGSAHFFIDDAATTGEECAGAVTLLRTWDAPGGK